MNKILIIDDDRELCALIKRSVQAENIEADFCNTGKEGLQKLREQEQIDNITDMREEALDMEQLQKRPGLVGYIAKDGDSLWSIAKENHTTVEDILRDNHRTDEDLRRGEKILIVKKVELNSYES